MPFEQRHDMPKAVLITLKVLMLFWPVVFLLSHRNIVTDFTFMAVALLCAKPIRHAVQQALTTKKDWVLILALVFSTYALASMLWAPALSYFDDGFGQVFFVIFSFVILTSVSFLGGKFRDLYFLVGFLAVLLLGFEGVTGGWLRQIIPPDNIPGKDIVSAARGVTLCIFLLPALLLMVAEGTGPLGLLSRYGKWILGLLLFLLLMIGAVRFDVAANVLALVAIVGVGMVAWRWPSFSINAVCAGVIFMLLLMPILMSLAPDTQTLSGLEHGPASWRMRLVIWKYTSGEIFSSPMTFLFGHGLQAAKAMTEMSPPLVIAGGPPDARMLPTHPHNLFLQIWFEYGLAGALILAGCFAAVRRKLLALAVLGPAFSAAIAAFVGMVFIFCVIETSLWTQWRLEGPILGFWGILLAIRPNQIAENTR